MTGSPCPRRGGPYARHGIPARYPAHHQTVAAGAPDADVFGNDARAIDVLSISHVINYDIQDTADAYTHRIGRTGRAAKTGDAFTFMTREDEALVRGIERVIGSTIERRMLHDFDYKKLPPARDTEFARPPREPQRSRRQHAFAQYDALADRNTTPNLTPEPTQPRHGRTRRTGAKTFSPSGKRRGR